MELSFYPLDCINCDKKDKNQAEIEYEILWADELEILNLMGKCDAESFFEHDKASEIINNNKIIPREHIQNFKKDYFTLHYLSDQLISKTINIDKGKA